MYVQGERIVGLRGWMIVWCRRCSISPIVTSTDWGLYCHASSLSVLCIRGHLSPLHEASRRSGMLWSPLLTWVHSQYCTIIYHIEKLLGMNITSQHTQIYNWNVAIIKQNVTAHIMCSLHVTSTLNVISPLIGYCSYVT